ncbi:hypothetical protein OGZ01_07445 [Vibrio harveyi]|nr:hypothetical protein [Vibrio harveyi]
MFEQLTFIHTVNDSEKDANGVTNTALKQFVSQTSNEGDWASTLPPMSSDLNANVFKLLPSSSGGQK